MPSLPATLTFPGPSSQSPTKDSSAALISARTCSGVYYCCHGSTPSAPSYWQASTGALSPACIAQLDPTQTPEPATLVWLPGPGTHYPLTLRKAQLATPDCTLSPRLHRRGHRPWQLCQRPEWSYKLEGGHLLLPNKAPLSVSNNHGLHTAPTPALYSIPCSTTSEEFSIIRAQGRSRNPSACNCTGSQAGPRDHRGQIRPRHPSLCSLRYAPYPGLQL